MLHHILLGKNGLKIPIGLRGMLVLWSILTPLWCGPQCRLLLEMPGEGQCNHHKCSFLGDLVWPSVEHNDCGREFVRVL